MKQQLNILQHINLKEIKSKEMRPEGTRQVD